MEVVEVTPEVVAGQVNGGEDLYLAFTCEFEGENVPDEFDVQLAVDDYLPGVDVTLEDEEAAEEFYAEGGVYTGRVRYRSNAYEFEWQGTAADARLLVTEALKDKKNWRFHHHPGDNPKLRFEHRHYVAGNAD